MLRFIIFIIIMCWLMSMCSCSKDNEYIQNPICKRVYELSDKYKLDSSYIKTDTLWPWGKYNNVFCNSDTLQFVNLTVSMKVCTTETLEIRRYVIGNVITKPNLYK